MPHQRRRQLYCRLLALAANDHVEEGVVAQHRVRRIARVDAPVNEGRFGEVFAQDVGGAHGDRMGGGRSGMADHHAVGRIAGQLIRQGIVVPAAHVIVDQADAMAGIEQRPTEEDESQRHLVAKAGAVG